MGHGSPRRACSLPRRAPQRQHADAPAQKCSVAKSNAAAKKIEAKLKCQRRAVQEGTAVDPACLTPAETKFDGAITKAPKRRADAP
jgi:hypothetical protein